jgi:hypothetical protein
MKTFTEIHDQYFYLQAELEIKHLQHMKLHQIDMLSGEGSKLRERMNLIKGMMKALDWVLKDQINGDLYEQLERNTGTDSAIREDAGNKDLP